MKHEDLNYRLVSDETRRINKRWNALIRIIVTLRKDYKNRYNISPNTILIGNEEDEIFFEYVVVHNLSIPVLPDFTTDGTSLLGCNIMKVHCSSYIQVGLIDYDYDGDAEED